MGWERQITTTATQASYWADQSKFADATVTTTDPATLGCSRCTCVFTRTSPTGAREDVANIGLSIAFIVGGGLYAPLTGAQQVTAETPLVTWWTSQKASTSSAWTLSEFHWHQHRADTPLSGPATRIVALNAAGTVAASRLPDQDAATVSFRTSSRKHWGRVYLPGFPYTAVDSSYARLTPTYVDATALNMRTLYNSLDASSLALGVWSQQYQAFLTIDEIRVDNVVDIQRRRRAKVSTYMKAYVS